MTREVTCQEFSQCYDDVNICLWTNGSVLTQSAAQAACQQRNSFLPRVTNSSIQSKLADFRIAANNFSDSRLLGGSGFWIDARAVGINNWHWIDGSPFAGQFVSARIERNIHRWNKLAVSHVGVNVVNVRPTVDNNNAHDISYVSVSNRRYFNRLYTLVVYLNHVQTRHFCYFSWDLQ